MLWVLPAWGTEPPPLVLDTFDAVSSGGSTIPGSSWVGQVTRHPTAISIGGTARNDNGWQAQNLDLDATGMTALALTGRRDAGLAPLQHHIIIELQDRNLNTLVLTVPADAFPSDEFATVTIPLVSWGAAFDCTRISGWSIGGGAPPPGWVPFRMTFAHLELTADGGPPAATLPVVTEQPVDQEAIAGSRVTLTVAIQGAPSLAYQCFRYGTVRPGATNPTLTFNAVSPANAGVYAVAVTNDAGSILSNHSTLRVRKAES